MDPELKFRENPYFVLGLEPVADRGAVEREGRKLLAQLEMGLAAAKRYQTPLGSMDRTPEGVREAMARLADPDQRYLLQWWAQARALEPAQVKHYEALAREGQEQHACMMQHFKIGSWSR
jgi:hypothetical protein